MGPAILTDIIPGFSQSCCRAHLKKSVHVLMGKKFVDFMDPEDLFAVSILILVVTLLLAKSTIIV
jgi:hypothetical protein